MGISRRPRTRTLTFKLGEKAPDPTKRALMLDRQGLTTPPPPPALTDSLSKVGSWPIYGNDKYGDCVWAMIGHTIQAWTTYATGTTVTLPLAAGLKGRPGTGPGSGRTGCSVPGSGTGPGRGS